jgi:hypothetical protein
MIRFPFSCRIISEKLVVRRFVSSRMYNLVKKAHWCARSMRTTNIWEKGNDKDIHRVLVVLWYQKVVVVNHLVGGFGSCCSEHLEQVEDLVIGR